MGGGSCANSVSGLERERCQRLRSANEDAGDRQAAADWQSLCDDDALTDGLAEAGVDVWARLGLALKHWTAAAE